LYRDQVKKRRKKRKKHFHQWTLEIKGKGRMGISSQNRAPLFDLVDNYYSVSDRVLPRGKRTLRLKFIPKRFIGFIKWSLNAVKKKKQS
jgi:hypothetical protein